MKIKILLCCFVTIGCIIAILSSAGCEISNEDDDMQESSKEDKDMQEISKEQAINIMREEVKQLPKERRAPLEEIDPEVTREEGLYIVTYPIDSPVEYRGADYLLQYEIDAKTGEILQKRAPR